MGRVGGDSEFYKRCRKGGKGGTSIKVQPSPTRRLTYHCGHGRAVGLQTVYLFLLVCVSITWVSTMPKCD